MLLQGCDSHDMINAYAELWFYELIELVVANPGLGLVAGFIVLVVPWLIVLVQCCTRPSAPHPSAPHAEDTAPRASDTLSEQLETEASSVAQQMPADSDQADTEPRREQQNILRNRGIAGEADASACDNDGERATPSCSAGIPASGHARNTKAIGGLCFSKQRQQWCSSDHARDARVLHGSAR